VLETLATALSIYVQSALACISSIVHQEEVLGMQATALSAAIATAIRSVSRAPEMPSFNATSIDFDRYTR
jgi:hypothetical protein